MVVLTTLGAIGAAPRRVAAHVAPAVDENNRYLKLTPLGDRLRLAYTIFIGERPGAQLRRHLDRNRDGQIDDAEADAYGERMAGLVRPAVALTLDGAPAAIDWATIDVGLGTPSVTGGALSIDLVGWACTGGAAHRLELRDTVALDKPGETELRIEDGPGITLGDRRLGGTPFDGVEVKWTGADDRLARGLELAWTVGAAAPRPADQRCVRNADAPQRRWLWGVVVALAVIAGGAVWWRRRAPAYRQRNVNG